MDNLKKPYIVLLGAAILGMIAAFVLSVEKIHLLQDPDAVLSCSFNLVLNCSVVMQSWQSAVFFGIPNMYIGMIAFPVLVTVAVAALWGGAQFNKGFLRVMTIGVLLGTVFSYWLFFSSLYVIQVLCPWCLLVTFACTLLLATSIHIGIKQNIWNLSKKKDAAAKQFLAKGYHNLVVASWLVLMIALVFVQFGTNLFL